MPSTLSMLPASAGLKLTPALGPGSGALWDLGRPEVGPGVSRQSRHSQTLVLPTHISQAPLSPHLGAHAAWRTHSLPAQS